MFERFTEDARSVVVAAQETARELRDPFIDGAHLLVGLATVDGPARRALTAAGVDRQRLLTAIREADEPATGLDAQASAGIGIDLGTVRAAVEASFGEGALEAANGPGHRRRRRPSGHLPFTGGAKKALELSLRVAVGSGERSLDGRHVLLGVLDAGEARAARVLVRLGTDVGGLRRTLTDRDAA